MEPQYSTFTYNPLKEFVDGALEQLTSTRAAVNHTFGDITLRLWFLDETRIDFEIHRKNETLVSATPRQITNALSDNLVNYIETMGKL